MEMQETTKRRLDARLQAADVFEFARGPGATRPTSSMQFAFGVSLVRFGVRLRATNDFRVVPTGAVSCTSHHFDPNLG